MYNHYKDGLVCWHDLLKEIMVEQSDDFDSRIVYQEIDTMLNKFDDSYGGTEGQPFTAWGKKNVYFPICYDGAEWIGWAPRNPCEIAMEHQGGG